MIRTIVVDDEILSRIGIQSFIDGKEEISVSGVFGEALEAIDFLRENPVDVVITDIEMSEMNGLDFIKVIRQEHLAQGVIILSCHDDFSYAQEAIANGTDSYILKHNVTEEKLIAEIKKVYKKTQENNPGIHIRTAFPKEAEQTEEEKCVIGMMKIVSGSGPEQKQENLPEDVMLIHLLEDIMERNKLGTVFAPYNKKIFTVFRFSKECSENEIVECLKNNIVIIEKNVKQYINGKIIFGLSTCFSDLQLMREKYEEAEDALQLSFYEPEKGCFYYKKRNNQWKLPPFSVSDFTKLQGLEKFESELSGMLDKAGFYEVNVGRLKESLIQAVMLMMYQVMKDNDVEEDFVNKWNSEVEIISVIQSAQNRNILCQTLLNILGRFQKELKDYLENDEMSAVFHYIGQHLNENISLTELAKLARMSIPSFCKKFKDKTGLTMVQYMNEKRIEKAKLLLKNRKLSLEQVAELTGFSNANYLIRVFKKMTGQTVSEYRKRFDISE